MQSGREIHVQAYLERWGSEEVTRACKQLTGLEGIRVRSLAAMRRLLWLAMIAVGIQALILLTRPRLRRAILDRAKEFIPEVLPASLEEASTAILAHAA